MWIVLFGVATLCRAESVAWDYQWRYTGEWSELKGNGQAVLQGITGCWTFWNISGTEDQGHIAYASSSPGKPPFSLDYAINLQGTYTRTQQGVYNVQMSGEKFAAFFEWYDLQMNATAYFDSKTSTLQGTSAPPFKLVGTASCVTNGLDGVLILNANMQSSSCETWTSLVFGGTSAVSVEYFEGS
jgi:hypothetical protein